LQTRIQVLLDHRHRRAASWQSGTHKWLLKPAWSKQSIIFWAFTDRDDERKPCR